MNRRMTAILAVVFVLAGTMASAQQWTRAGAPGGGAIRALLRDGGWLIAAADAGLFRSSDMGQTWSSVGTGTFTSLAHARGTAIVAGALDGRLLQSSDAGANWTSIAAGLPMLGSVRSVLWSPSTPFFGAGLIVATNLGLYMRPDDSATFEPATMLGLSNGSLWGVAIDATAAQTATYSGPFMLGAADTAWRAPAVGPGDFTTALGHFGGRLYAATLDGVKVSADGGATWIDTLGGVADSATFELLAVDRRMFVASSNGVLITGFGGKWRDVSAGLPGTAVLALANDSTLIFAGLENGDVYTRSLNTFTGVEVDASNERARGLVVESVIPSPAHNEVTVQWSAARSGPVRITLVDALGRRCANRDVATSGIGSHTARLDVSAVASGVYELEITDGVTRDGASVVIVH